DRPGDEPTPDFLSGSTIGENHDNRPLRYLIHIDASCSPPNTKAVVLNIKTLPRRHKVGNQEVGLFADARNETISLQLRFQSVANAPFIQGTLCQRITRLAVLLMEIIGLELGEIKRMIIIGLHRLSQDRN